MLYSHTSALAIRAALFLALQPPGKLSPVHEIAQGTGLPASYLAKIVRRLIRAGLVRAFRGPGGGLELGRAPQAITLWMVVQAMDGSGQSERCVLGLRACSEESPCPLHLRYFPLRLEIRRLLEETTLASLARGLREASGLSPESFVEIAGEATRRTSPGQRKAEGVPVTPSGKANKRRKSSSGFLTRSSEVGEKT